MAVYTDIISGRTGTSRALMGLIFLATAAQLPKTVSNATAAISDNASLVVNSMFGGISMQTAVLVIERQQ